MSLQPNNLNVAYGLSQSLLNVFPSPIVSLRSPATSDKAQIGTVWVNTNTNTGYLLTSIVNNSATWQEFGGQGIFTDLTVNGVSTLTGTTHINTTGSAATVIATGGTGTLQLGNATGNTALTGTLATSGNLTVNTGGLDVLAGGMSITGTTFINITGSGTTEIGTGGTGAVSIGNTTGNTSVTGTLTSSGNIILSTAATGILLPGPTKIINGAGAPASGLAAEVGDIYINTTAATAATRMYIATAAGTWTNVTCAG
jgi:hypothetical protein